MILKLLAYIIILEYLIINIYLLNNKMKKNISRENILVKNATELLICVLVIISYILIYFFGLRLLRIFLNKKININVYQLLDYNLNLDYTLIVFSCIILVLILLVIKNIFFKKLKMYFLKAHYAYLMKFSSYQQGFNFVYCLDLKIYNLLNKNKVLFAIYYFIMLHGFKIYALYQLVYGLIWCNGTIYIAWLPWYGLYYFFVQIYVSMCLFQQDFDRAITLCYYPQFATVTGYGLYKINCYKDKLILGSSEYIFEDSIIFKYHDKYPNNMLFFFTWKPWYSGIDIYEIAKVNKAIFFSHESV